jgi:hypothetical protein
MQKDKGVAFQLSAGSNSLDSVVNSALSVDKVSAKVYEWWASSLPTCNSPVLIAEIATPQLTNFSDNPLLASSNIKKEKYACFIAVISDTITASVQKAGPTKTCKVNQTITHKECLPGQTSLLPDGAMGKMITCTAEENKIALYFSTQAPPSTFPSNYLYPPASTLDRGHAGHLSYAPMIAHPTAATFILQAAAKEVQEKSHENCILFTRWDMHISTF